MKRILMTMGMMLASCAAMADTEVIDGIEWTYTISDGKASVGSGNYNGARAIPTSKTGAIAIPSKLGGYPVTSIGNSAFYGCSGLTSVTIPSSVTSIGEYAFFACGKLTSVTIPSSVTSIGKNAFRSCSGLTSVTIPSSVTSIGLAAFSDCSGLTSFAVAEANMSYKSVNGLLLTKDGKTLVAGINDVVVIPESVTSIGDIAFDGCRGLTSVTIPSSVTSIGKYAFRSCSGLTSVTIPSSVTSIGLAAFDGCSGLTSVTIPSSVTSIGNSAFFGCIRLTGVTISEGVTSIGDWAFYNCNGLTNVTIPSSVTSIGSSAFSWCSGLTSVDFEGAPPSGLSSASIETDVAIRYNVAHEDQWLPVIEQCGFTNATPYTPPKRDGGPYTEVVDGVEWTFNVENGKATVTTPNPSTGAVTIPSMLGGRSVTSIGDAAFRNCSGLTSVTIPSSVKTIGNSVFEGCGKLADVYFEGDTLSSIGADAFRGCYWDLIMHVPETWRGRGRTICGYTILKGCIFIVK